MNLPPNGKLGEAAISEVEVSSFDTMRSSFDTAATGFPFTVLPGKYKRLHIGGVLQMSNTRMEQITNRDFVREARGQVLIAGLGIGYVLTQILPKKEVLYVTVIEKCPDLIKMVAAHYRNVKLSILEGDINSWRPRRGAKYDVIYFDIWPSVSCENLEDMNRLHRRFKPFLLEGGYINSWSREGLQRMKRRGY